MEHMLWWCTGEAVVLSLENDGLLCCPCHAAACFYTARSLEHYLFPVPGGSLRKKTISVTIQPVGRLKEDITDLCVLGNFSSVMKTQYLRVFPSSHR